MLADLVRQAHQGRAWTALGYASWAEYAATEFGVSRAQAYRLIDISTTAGRLLATAADLKLASPTRDIGVFGRALRDRIDAVAELPAARVDQARTAGQELTGDDVAALIRQGPVARTFRAAQVCARVGPRSALPVPEPRTRHGLGRDWPVRGGGVSLAVGDGYGFPELVGEGV